MLQYVNTSNNHPKHIIENIPKGVEKRLCQISANEEVFMKAIPPYQEALNRAGHTYKLKYTPPKPDNPEKRQRSRKILYYNPPFSKTLKTKLGKKFFEILDKCFPPTHPLHKHFNRHTIKLSFSCMPNMGKLIAGHNKKILNKTDPPENLCNCRIKKDCPIENKCLLTDVIYQASVTRLDNSVKETYVGLASTSFKARWSNHKTSFNLESHEKETRLSIHVWDLKRKGIDYELKWQILAKSKSYSPSSKKCWLCLKEKYYILFGGELSTLNKRHEFFTPCLHKQKFKLINQK